jgi:hypothetical protein
MLKEGKVMKYLKVDNCQALYSLNGIEWITIDKIDKDDLIALLNLAVEGEFIMDDYVDGVIKNPAHNIIYSDLSRKFNELLKKKNRFKDESESLYKNALMKYSISEDEKAIIID